MTNDLRTVERKYDNLSEYSIQVNRWILKPIGAWPAQNSTTSFEKITSRILTVICWCFWMLTIIPGALNIILEKEDMYIKLKTLGPLSDWSVGGFNYAMLLLRRNDIHNCIEHIRTDWKMITRSEDQQVMLKNAKVGRYIAGFCAAFMQGGVFCGCIAAGVFQRTVEVGNETVIIYTLPCPPYKLPVQTKSIHDIVLSIQFLAAFIAVSSTTGAFGLAIVFASHALGQLNIMVPWINEFINQQSRDQNSNACVNKIGAIVEHHLRVLR
ncbi:hypothetical protein K0M31_017761 [Melipona bicolor]|uniref:Uncharacterized protein n=1 Tax=Melipona bicolor TaxID=60889 RepID=A0AA40G5N9_9HYME|nr:hypothetical protein K0M31_017761 [Melipona bicolor]